MKSWPTKKLGMGMKYFFDIPVFRCTPEKWRAEYEKEKKELTEYYKKQSGKIAPNFDYESLAQSSLNYRFSDFFYNEMIGMIKLFILGDQIRGELWFIKGRVRKGLKRKSWHLQSMKMFEIHIFEGDTNAKIFRKIIKELENESKQKPLKARFIDMNAFRNCGKYIDYLRLINNE